MRGKPGKFKTRVLRIACYDLSHVSCSHMLQGLLVSYNCNNFNLFLKRKCSKTHLSSTSYAVVQMKKI